MRCSFRRITRLSNVTRLERPNTERQSKCMKCANVSSGVAYILLVVLERMSLTHSLPSVVCVTRPTTCLSNRTFNVPSLACLNCKVKRPSCFTSKMKNKSQNADMRIGAATSAAPYPLALLVGDYLYLFKISAMAVASSTLIFEPCFSCAFCQDLNAARSVSSGVFFVAAAYNARSVLSFFFSE